MFSGSVKNMISEILESEWFEYFPIVGNIVYKCVETDESFAECFAIAMEKACNYQAIKGSREHINYFYRKGKHYEDRDYWFIDLCLITFIKYIGVNAEKYANRNQRIRIRNMAIKYHLTKYLERGY